MESTRSWWHQNFLPQCKKSDLLDLHHTVFAQLYTFIVGAGLEVVQKRALVNPLLSTNRDESQKAVGAAACYFHTRSFFSSSFHSQHSPRAIAGAGTRLVNVMRFVISLCVKLNALSRQHFAEITNRLHFRDEYPRRPCPTRTAFRLLARFCGLHALIWKSFFAPRRETNFHLVFGQLGFTSMWGRHN